MIQEIEFVKYKQRGAGYHYKQIDKLNFRKFNAFVYARFIKHLDLVKDHIKNNFNEDALIKILDVGCGDGVLLYLIKNKIKNYNIKAYGTDLSEVALEVAQKKVPNSRFIKADVYNLNFQNDYFDIVISSDVIEHVSSPEKMLKEMKRVAKDNAYIIIGTPIRCTKEPLDKNHFQEFYKEDFENLMSHCFENFEIVESHELLYDLLYQKPFNIFYKRILIFRYLINLLAILLNINLFLKGRKYKNQLFRNMYAICKNK